MLCEKPVPKSKLFIPICDRECFYHLLTVLKTIDEKDLRGFITLCAALPFVPKVESTGS
jgi:hypothetical protein